MDASTIDTPLEGGQALQEWSGRRLVRGRWMHSA